MNIYTRIYLVLAVITLITYLSGFHRKKWYGKMVILHLVLCLTTTVTAIALIKYGHFRNNLFVFHIATPIEYAIFAMLYANVIVNSKLKKYIIYSIPAFALLCILFFLVVQPLTVNNSYVVMIESIIMVGLSLYFLRQLLLLQQVESLNSFPMFWICVAILFYFVGSLVIEGMLNYLMRHSMELARKTYRVGYIFKYLLFLLFIVGAFSSRRQSKEAA
ncbi:MAG TPA: hypothetical protein VF487_15425 [Chitinophagaceae bacterium]